jgi:hypothetical protein
MSEDESPAPEATEATDASDETDETAAKKSEVKITGALSRESDMASRPGFRSPSNKRSKALKNKRKKKKGR